MLKAYCTYTLLGAVLMSKLIERKFEIEKLPQVGDKEVNGEKLFVQATGVRFKRQPVTGEYFFDLDKKFFIAKDGKGNFINGKIVGEYL